MERRGIEAEKGLLLYNSRDIVHFLDKDREKRALLRAVHEAFTFILPHMLCVKI